MKRTFAMLLALVMVLSMVPFAAFAAQTLTIGENTAVLTGDGDGVKYTWIATETGTLTVTMPEPGDDYIWEYYVDNMDDEKEPVLHYSDGYEAEDGNPVVSEMIEVTIDDEIEVYVNITEDGETYCEGELTFTAAFETAAGSESQPIELLDSDTTDGAVITADISVPARKTLYYSIPRIQNMILTVSGEGSFTVNCGDRSAAAVDGVATIEGVSAASMYAPLVISVENTGSAVLNAQVKFTFPLGAYNNPEVIEELGELTTTLEAGDSDGYYYIWTAQQAGVLSFDIYVPMAELTADIVLTNQASYEIATLKDNGVETVFGDELTYTTVSINVAAGEPVLITVSAIPVENAYPAMTVESSCYFTAPAGTEDNPILLNIAEEEEFQLSVPAGETIYCVNTGNVNGMIFNMTGGAASVAHNGATYTAADGAVSFTCVQASTNEPAMFAITNTGSTETVYKVSFVAPLGSWENPEALVLNVPTTATVKAGSNGYNYTWTAQEEGVFTVTVDAAAATNGWFYTITNNATAEATEEHTSALYDSDGNAVTPVTSDSVEVYAGDEIIVTVNTYDSTNPNAAPAGSVTFTAGFEAGEVGGDEGGDGGDDDVPTGGEIASGTSVTASVDAPVTFEYTPATNGTMTIVISGTKGFKVEVRDVDGGTVGLPRAFSSGAQQMLTFELSAGVAYTVRIVGYVSYDEGTSVVTYTATWEAGSGAGGDVEKAEYEVDYDHALVLGDNALTLLDTAITTIYEFEPTETGVYTFTAPADAIVGYWGAGEWFLQDPGSDSNVCEWTCTGVGQSAYIGVSGVDGQFNLNVIRTGDYQEAVVIEKVYENKADLSAFTLPENAVLGEYVDVYGQTHTAVLGDDGYYHLDSADGDILLVDMNYQDIVLSNALKSDRPVMNIYVNNDDGSRTKYDIGNAVLAYEAVMDEDGYYPLTEDLIFFYKDYTASAGTWSYYLPDGGYNEESVWMYCCRTVTFAEIIGSEDNPHVIEEMTGHIDVEAGVTYAMITAQYNGRILKVDAPEGVVVTVNGEAVGAEGIVLTGVPTNKVVITAEAAATVNFAFEYALGSEGNPIAIDENTQTIEAKPGQTYYTINAKYNGKILKISAAEGISATVNGIAMTAEGVALTEDPTNKIVVTNDNQEAVTLTVSIEDEQTDLPDYNGLVVVDGVWGYYEGGVLQVDYTGLVPYGDILFYVENGILDFTYTGLVWHLDAWRYVANSQLTEGYTGLVWFNDNWFYTVDSVIDWTFTGLVPYEGNYFYVQNNLLDWSYTSLGYHDGNWYFIQNGLLQKDYSGLVYFNDNWFYVEEGVLTYQYFGMVEYQGNMFYVQASHLDWSYTGLGFHEGNWYYFLNALYMPDYNGLAALEGNYFYVVGGVVDWSVNGLREVDGVLYYFVDSLLDWTFTGTAEYEGKTYNVVGGVVEL